MKGTWTVLLSIGVLSVALASFGLLHLRRPSAPSGNTASLGFKPASGSSTALSTSGDTSNARPFARVTRTPLTFEPDIGQTNPQAKFLAHGAGYELFLSGDAVVLDLRSQKSGVRSQLERRAWLRQPNLAPRWRSGLLPALLDWPVSFTSEFRTQNPELSAASSFVRLRLIGANAHPRIVGLDKLKGKSNYFIGNDPKKWRTNVPNYARVMVKDLYSGIDQVFYGKDGQLEYDFVVHPGADPEQIRLVAETQNWKLENGKWKLVTGNRQLATAPNGDLALQTDAGEVRLEKPIVYQMASGLTNRKSAIENRKFLDSHYVLSAKNELSIALGSYDPTREVVIDPTLNYIALFGGTNGDTDGHGIAVDSSGNAYVTGITGATNFSTTPGAFEPAPPGLGGSFVRKLDPSGATVYSTYLAGSSGGDISYGIAVDSSGDAYVTGTTESTDFPVLNAFQPTLAGGGDAFVTELNPTGSALVYSSYLGGALSADINSQQGLGIAVDSGGNAYVAGATRSADFPITPNAFQPVFGGGQCPGAVGPLPCLDAFVTKVAAGGSALVYSTYLGGSLNDYGQGIAVDPAGDAYVAGGTQSFDFPVLNAFQAACVPRATYSTCENAFVAELDAAGSALVFSTYLGGSGDFGDNALSIALDSTGDIYVTGDTSSTDFPVANAWQSSCGSPSVPGVLAGPGFLTEFNPGATRLVYSTCFLDSPIRSVAVDSLGEAYITGDTGPDLPLVNPVQSTYGGGESDAFVTAFEAGGAGLIYSTFLGGNLTDRGNGVAVDPAGNAWVTGESNSTIFVAAISLGPRFRRDVVPRRLSSTSSVNQGLGGSISLDMARVHAAPSSLEFGAEVAGTTSAPETVTISNPGTAPLTFSAITASDSFAVPSGGSCSTSSSVAPGGNCTVDVAFAPTVGGNLTGTLTLTDNGIGSPHSVPLSGTGQDFTLSTNQSSATLKAGVTATILFSVAPQGGFNHPLDLSCDDPAPHSTCTITPSSVTPNPASGATVAVSITTTASSQAAPRGPNGPGPIAGQRPALQLCLMALAMLALLAVAAMSSSPRVAALLRRRVAQSLRGSNSAALVSGVTGKPQSFWTGRPRGAPLRYLLALALLLLLAWAACGGGGQPGTPAGTYTVTLKALDTQANLSHSTTVTLTVH